MYYEQEKLKQMQAEIDSSPMGRALDALGEEAEALGQRKAFADFLREMAVAIVDGMPEGHAKNVKLMFNELDGLTEAAKPVMLIAAGRGDEFTPEQVEAIRSMVKACTATIKANTPNT